MKRNTHLILMWMNNIGDKMHIFSCETMAKKKTDATAAQAMTATHIMLISFWKKKGFGFFFLNIFDLEDIYPAKIGAWVCDDNCGIFLRHPSCDVKCWTNLVLQHKILYVDMYVYRIHWYFVLAVLLLFLRHDNCKYMWWHQNSWYKNDPLTRQGWQLK